jgi:hypothetical protein
MAVIPYVVVVLLVSDDVVAKRRRGRSLCDIEIAQCEQPA